MVFMIQHLSHRNSHGILSWVSVTGIFYLLNDRTLIPVNFEHHGQLLRVLLVLFLCLWLLRTVLNLKIGIVFLILIPLLSFIGVTLMRPGLVPDFSSYLTKVDLRWLVFFVFFSCLVFKFRKKRNFMLHRRFLYYILFLNLVSISLNFGEVPYLSSFFDFLTFVFLIYFINLFLVKISFNSKMREVSC